MFKLLGWMIKAAFITTVILVLGNTLYFHGKTVSDQVKTTLSHAENSDAVNGIQTWTHEISTDVGVKAHKAAVATKQRLLKKIAAQKNSPSEDIQASERQELRNLIRQLNDSTQKLSTN